MLPCWRGPSLPLGMLPFCPCGASSEKEISLQLPCCAGMCAGTVGTATSNGLLALRKKLDPSYTSPVSGCLWMPRLLSHHASCLLCTPHWLLKSRLHCRTHVRLLSKAPPILRLVPAIPSLPRSWAPTNPTKHQPINHPYCAERGPVHPGQRLLLGAAHGPVRQPAVPSAQRPGHGEFLGLLNMTAVVKPALC